MQKGPVVVLSLLFVALSGCLGGNDAIRPVVDLPTPSEGAWERVLLNTDAEAGGWMLGSQSLPEGLDFLSYDIQIELRVSGGDEWAAIILPPVPYYTVDGGSDLLLAGPSPTFRLGSGTETLTVATTREIGRVGGNLAVEGFVFGVASTAPWQLKFALHAAHEGGHRGTDVAPETLARGNGTTLTIGGDRPLGEPAGAAGRIALDLSTDAPGWTHLGILSDDVQRIGLQRVVAAFADGETLEVTGRSSAVDTPVYSSASPTTMADHFGNLGNDAGDNRLEATYARATTGQRMIALHMPGAQDGLPAALAKATYMGATKVV